MSQELERVYTINLGKALISQSQHRAVRAVNMIKEFARHHMKTEEVKIDEELAHIIWARGVRRPPRKIRVRMAKTDEGFILVTPYSEEEAPAVSDKKTKKEAEKVAKEVTKKVEEKSETKLEESKEEVAKPEPTKEPEKKPEPTKEPEKKPEPTKEPEKKPEPTKEPEKKPEPTKEPEKKPEKDSKE